MDDHFWLILIIYYHNLSIFDLIDPSLDNFWPILTIHNHFHQFLDDSVPIFNQLRPNFAHFPPILTIYNQFPINFASFKLIKSNSIPSELTSLDINQPNTTHSPALPSGFFRDSFKILFNGFVYRQCLSAGSRDDSFGLSRPFTFAFFFCLVLWAFVFTRIFESFLFGLTISCPPQRQSTRQK